MDATQVSAAAAGHGVSRGAVARASLLVLGVVVGCAALIDALARSERLIDWMLARWIVHWQGSNHVPPHRPFLTRSDQLFLEDIPRADYSAGGVYYFGSSKLGTCLTTWSLPPEQQRLIHNYVVAGSSHTDHLHFIRYLIEEEGWLAAGGEKTKAVLAVFFGNAKRGSWFDNAFQNGLYTYDRNVGLHKNDRSALYRFLATEELRCRLFLLTCGEVLHLNDELQLDAKLMRQRGMSAYSEEVFKGRWKRRMGREWEPEMEEELGALAATMELLHRHRARVHVVLLPIGSWHRELPYHQPFLQAVTALCREQSVPMLDLSGLLADGEFVDQVHMNFAGAQKTQAALVDVALQHLRETGALR